MIYAYEAEQYFFKVISPEKVIDWPVESILLKGETLCERCDWAFPWYWY
jgi:hypothetical protein